MFGVPDWTIVSAVCFIVTAPTVTLVFVVRSIITGKLVPRTTHQQVIDDKNDWRDVARKLQASDSLKTETVSTQAEAIKTQNEVGAFASQVMEAVRRQSEEKP